MKQFNRANLPKEIKYNGKTYYYLCSTERGRDTLVITGYCNSNNRSMIQVNVLQGILKGREDLHGQPYQPSTWIFCNPAPEEAHKDELSNLILQAREFQAEMRENSINRWK